VEKFVFDFCFFLNCSLKRKKRRIAFGKYLQVFFHPKEKNMVKLFYCSRKICGFLLLVFKIW